MGPHAGYNANAWAPYRAKYVESGSYATKEDGTNIYIIQNIKFSQ